MNQKGLDTPQWGRRAEMNIMTMIGILLIASAIPVVVMLILYKLNERR